MAVSQNELATDFFNEVKSLQPQMPKLACDTKRKHFNEKFFSEFSPTEQTFLKQLIFLNLKLPTVNYNIFWEF